MYYIQMSNINSDTNISENDKFNFERPFDPKNLWVIPSLDKNTSTSDIQNNIESLGIVDVLKVHERINKSNKEKKRIIIYINWKESEMAKYWKNYMDNGGNLKISNYQDVINNDSVNYSNNTPWLWLVEKYAKRIN